MQRRHDLDAVRIAAFALLVLYHVGMYYVSWDWHVKSPHAGPALEPLMILTAPWRLSLLFLISGVATAFMLDKAPAGLLRRRSWRLLVPLAFGMAVVVAPQAYYEVVEKMPGGYREGYWTFYGRYLTGYDGFCRDGECLAVPTWNHLWFVAYLWVYTMLLVPLARWAPSGWGERLGRAIDRRLAGPGLLLVPITVLAVERILLLPRFGSTHGLLDDFYNHAQYLFVFGLGFVIARRDRVWDAIGRQRWPALLLALAAYACLSVYYATYSGDRMPPDALLQAQRGAWAVMQWSAIVAILGFARGWVTASSPALRYLGEAIFPVYILHQTVIVVLAHHLKPLALTPAIEGPLLVVATFGLCLLGFEAIRRVPVLRPLFGLSYRPRRDGIPSAGAAGANAPA